MALASVNAQADFFAPTALISLFTLDSRFVSVNGSVYRFCSSVNGQYRPVVFDGITYTPLPIEVDGFDILGDGGIPRPKLRASNINGFFSQFLLTQGDMVGARFTRTRVFARFLDNVNWERGNPYGTPDPTAAYEPDIYYVNRKVTENPEMVELELSSPFELDGAKLPRRPILSIQCAFHYRDPETCGYSGAPVSDRFGKLFEEAAPDGYGYTLNPRGAWTADNTYAVGDWVSIISENDFTYGETLVYVCAAANTTGASNNPQFNPTNWVPDGCPLNLLGCKAHFPTGPLPFGAFPGTSRSSFL